MAKKQYFLVTDTETTVQGKVADFAAVLVDRQGREFARLAVMVEGQYGKHELFHDVRSSEEIWTLKGLKKRHNIYKTMLNEGTRAMASVSYINNWLTQIQQQYKNVIFCAYYANFDLRVMRDTGIRTEGFADVFCLWAGSANHVIGNKKYITHCLERKWLTPKLNLRTNAEAMAEFALGRELDPEPHTALEDVLFYEIPVLLWLVKHRSYKKYSQKSFNWRDWQLKNLVIPK
jgi:hypothetical protein